MILPSAQKQLQANKRKNLRIWDFSAVRLRKRKRKKISGILFNFVSVACCCGLCVPNVIIAKANAKENLGEFFVAFPLRKRKRNIIFRERGNRALVIVF